MKKTAFVKKSIIVACLSLGIMSLSGQAAQIQLVEFAFNIDGFSGSDVLHAGVNAGGFDTNSGLGVLSIMLTAPGPHNALLYVDHEIDQGIGNNTFFDELGSTVGTPGVGQSWEIDEPGFIFGDIFDNVMDNTLDNAIGAGFPDDVSMALGFNFTLGADQKATVTWALSETAPASGFFLTHTDPKSDTSLFFSSNLTIQNVDAPLVPEPSTFAFVALGLVSCLSVYKPRRRASP